jgi:crotonobetainyl-CoA:carnitine CoA-transferase CaiB-like acyl-CoA transferase
MFYSAAMLSHYKVVDICDERGHPASHFLATLGADVTLVEPPEGSNARFVGPFSKHCDPPENSLTFWAYNRGKKSITLNLGTVDGLATFHDLITTADVLFECGAVDVDLEELKQLNPRLVIVSISAFGRTGPKAHWPATDLTLVASSTQMILSGDIDRAPVRISLPQAFLHASSDAAVGAMIALMERESSGQGQHVDTSAHRSLPVTTQGNVFAATYNAPLTLRTSGGSHANGIDFQFVYECADGYVNNMVLFGPSFGPHAQRLLQVMYDKGFIDESMNNEDLVAWGTDIFTGKVSLERYTELRNAVSAYCMAHTKAELFQHAIEYKLLTAPIATPKDVVENPQYAHRQFWDTVEDELLAPHAITVPGVYVKYSEEDIAPLGRAPRLNEHNDVVRQRLDESRTQKPVTPASTTAPRTLPFTGIKVLDLTWAISGPSTARMLCDYGAEVVHVETGSRQDAARSIGPYINDQKEPEYAGLFFTMNTGKKGMLLDLSTPEGREVLDDLVAWCDVLIESFSPRGRRSLGLDFDRLRTINPKLIMLSTCLFGQDGPLGAYAGYGTAGGAIAGFYHLTGWPDRPPCGPFGAYTDYPSPRFATCALITAIDHQRRTGMGQYLDFSQAESASNFLTPAILDYTVNGVIQDRTGNSDPYMSPHGVFPCEGDDTWIAIACRDDDDWKRLAKVIGRIDLVGMSYNDRKQHGERLHNMVSSWSSRRSAADAEAALIEANVPAHRVQHSDACMTDPQFIHTNHFVRIPHTMHGEVTVENSRMTLSETPANVSRRAPMFGEDTELILRSFLSYDDEKVKELQGKGVFK